MRRVFFMPAQLNERRLRSKASAEKMPVDSMLSMRISIRRSEADRQ